MKLCCATWRLSLVMLLLLIVADVAEAGTLTGSFASIPTGSNVNLTAIGRLDWVHWGLKSDSSIDRKGTVTPQISDFNVVYDTNFSYAAAYQYGDNANGYSWSDGTPSSSITNTTTGVYVVGPFNITETNGFEFSVPADTTLKTLKVFVGAYSARGRMVATLSDASTSGYTNTSLFNFTNGPAGAYTLNFAANSSNQTLNVHWVVSQRFQVDGNVTLQAATLDSAGANNPPAVSFLTPTNTAQFSAPASITLTAAAADTDGAIAKVEFLNGTNKLGEATNSPYAISWNNVPAGRYLIAARAFDTNGASSTTLFNEVFVYTNGGALTGSADSPPASVDLTAQGTWDWTHWGLDSATAFNTKLGVTRQISNFVKIGTNTVGRYSDNYTRFDWSDGQPVLSASSTTGVYIGGYQNGFELIAPADTTLRALTAYVGLYGGEGVLRACLSDATAPPYTARFRNNYGNSYVACTMTYAAATQGKTIHIEFTSEDLFDADFGNVTFQAATLSGSGTPQAIVLVNPKRSGDNFSFSFLSEPNWSYVVESCSALGDWQFWTNVTGNGNVISLTNTITDAARFYRVRAQ